MWLSLQGAGATCEVRMVRKGEEGRGKRASAIAPRVGCLLGGSNEGCEVVSKGHVPGLEDVAEVGAHSELRVVDAWAHTRVRVPARSGTVPLPAAGGGAPRSASRATVMSASFAFLRSLRETAEAPVVSPVCDRSSCESGEKVKMLSPPAASRTMQASPHSKAQVELTPTSFVH